MHKNPTCPDCRNSYQGADVVLRCRITGKPAEAACSKFEREPGADGCESKAHRVFYDCAWVLGEQGRGD